MNFLGSPGFSATTSPNSTLVCSTSKLFFITGQVEGSIITKCLKFILKTKFVTISFHEMDVFEIGAWGNNYVFSFGLW